MCDTLATTLFPLFIIIIIIIIKYMFYKDGQ